MDALEEFDLETPDPTASLVLRHGTRRWFVDARLIRLNCTTIAEFPGTLKPGEEFDLGSYDPDWGKMMEECGMDGAPSPTADVLASLFASLYRTTIFRRPPPTFQLLDCARFLGYHSAISDIDEASPANRTLTLPQRIALAARFDLPVLRAHLLREVRKPEIRPDLAAALRTSRAPDAFKLELALAAL